MASLVIVTPSSAKQATCMGKKATKVGSGRGETITGTKGNDVIVAKGGDDTVIGNGGNDVICGGGGADILDGEGGDDELHGGGGDDNLFGGEGRDSLSGAAGSDFFQGNAGNDALSGGDKTQPPFDVASFIDATGPVNINVLAGVASGDGVGTDSLKGLEDFEGSAFDDVMIGNNEGYGDGFFGLEGDDSLTGNGGDDVMRGGPGDDSLVGGEGFDSAQFFEPPDEPPHPVVVDLGTGTATGQGHDTISGIEFVQGSHGNDTLTGTDADEELHGLDGDDTIDAKGGNDFTAGGGADDHIDGGEGNDIGDHYVWESWAGSLGIDFNPVTVNLQDGTSTGQGTDVLIGIEETSGSSLDDSLTGSELADTLIGFDGNDVLTGGDGDDRLEADCELVFGGPCPLDDGTNDTTDGGAGTDQCANGETVTSCEGPIPPTGRWFTLEVVRSCPWGCEGARQRSRSAWGS